MPKREEEIAGIVTSSSSGEEGIVLIVRLWVEPSRVPEYERFEREATRVLVAHGARIERVIRRAADESPDAPFEVHVVRFPDRASLDAWREDPATRALAPTRDDVVARTEVYRGRAHSGYAEGVPVPDGTDEEVPALSARWSESPECLTTTYVFPSFGAAIRFMGDCVGVIDALDHHPDWSNAHRRVHVSLTTHSVGHVTDLDRRLAAALDRIHADHVR